MRSALHDPVRGTSEPGRLWTKTNVSEATPDILSPLCWDVWGPALEDGWLGSMHSFGVISAAAAVRSADTNDHSTCAIFGRQVMNIDAVRRMVARMPGVDPDAFERDIMGSSRPDAPPAPGAPGRLPIIAVKMPRAMLGAHKALHATYRATRDWWATEVRDVHAGTRQPVGTPVARLEEARRRFAEILQIHLVIRLQLQSVQGALTDAATKAGDESLATKVLSGQGGVQETKLADDLWRLGRKEITEAEFLAEHGYHGPNEGNVYTRSWREEPARVRALAAASGGRTDAARPRDREAKAVVASAQAQAALLAAASATARPTIRFMLTRARNIVRNLETGKSGFLMALDGCRAAARAIGTEQVAAGRLDAVDDAFFLTVDELARLADGALPEARDIVGFRRAARAEYQSGDIPVTFTGMPTLHVEEAVAPTNGAVVEVSGASSGGGIVEGRARVVLDPNEDVDLEPGDILVCRFTDPSWAPLFTMVDALVIDLGGPASHGAVVAREMGLPYVIGTGDGTKRIPEGARIHVDGEHNLVRVVD